jgi:hypothetical protein
MKMKSNKEIKQALVKTLNLKASQVSVSSPHHCSTTVRVHMMDRVIPLSKISAIAAQGESIRYCEASGEILQGGNHFVSAGYGRISADLQTLVWALFDRALTVCGTVESWSAARYHFANACAWAIKNVQDLEMFKEFTDSDFLNLAQDFAQDEVSAYINTGKR